MCACVCVSNDCYVFKIVTAYYALTCFLFSSFCAIPFVLAWMCRSKIHTDVFIHVYLCVYMYVVVLFYIIFLLSLSECWLFIQIWFVFSFISFPSLSLSFFSFASFYKNMYIDETGWISVSLVTTPLYISKQHSVPLTIHTTITIVWPGRRKSLKQLAFFNQLPIDTCQ